MSALPGSAATEPVPPDEPVEPRREPTSAAPRQTVDSLAEMIVREAGRPIDVWAIAALLESSGVRDLDAVERFGRRDVFHLAQAVQARLPADIPTWPREEEPLPPRAKRVRKAARLYARGAFFIVPLALQLTSLLVVGVSQFASVDFTLEQASVVAMAAVLSFLFTAGFVQAGGFIGPLFREPGKHMLVEKVLWRLVVTGAVGALAGGALILLVATASGAYTGAQARTGVVYAELMALSALLQGVLYSSKRYGTMIAATAAGIAAVVLLHETTDLAIRHVHWIGLGLSAVVEGVATAVVLRRAARETRGAMRLAQLPRMRLLVRRSLPFAVHGILYFAFVSADRLVAWADGSNPLPFWFRIDYELGLDLALGGVVFALAFLEISVERFSEMLQPLSERYRLSAVGEHNRVLRDFWRGQVAAVGVLVAVGGWVAIGAAFLLNELNALGPAEPYFHDPASHVAFAGALIGYAFLAVGLANSVFLMSVARAWKVVHALLPALAVNVGVGIFATSQGPHEAAVAGLVAGAVVFAGLSALHTARTLRRADYWTYAAW